MCRGSLGDAAARAEDGQARESRLIVVWHADIKGRLLELAEERHNGRDGAVDRDPSISNLARKNRRKEITGFGINPR